MLYATAMTAPVFGLRREIDRLFESTFARGQGARNEWVPAVDIRETDQVLSFEVEVPGIDPEEVEVTAADGVLTIHAEKAEQLNGAEDGRYHLTERNYGSFMRRFQLPQGVDGDKIEANVDRGVLQVRIPKALLPEPKKILVKAGADLNRRPQRSVGSGESR